MDWHVGIGEQSLYNYSISLDFLAVNPLQVLKQANRQFILQHHFQSSPLNNQHPILKLQLSITNVFLSSHPSWYVPPTFSHPSALLSQLLKTNMSPSHRPIPVHCLNQLKLVKRELVSLNQRTRQQLLQIPFPFFRTTRNCLSRKAKQGLSTNLQHRC